jgi:ferritin-like metal-binding protein YciE
MEECNDGYFHQRIKTMEDLFLHQLEDIYYAEQQLTKAIPKMAEMATNADLKAGLKSHVTIRRTRSSVSTRSSLSSVTA